MIKLKGVAMLTALFFSCMLAVSLNAMEPSKPETDHIFGLKEEQKIAELVSLPLDESYNRLKNFDFMLNDAFLNKAIFEAYGYRKKKAVDYALKVLQQPERKIINGNFSVGPDDLYIAKKIFEVFPDEAVGPLVSLYKKGNLGTKANVIRTLSKIAGGVPVKRLLTDALDDKSPVQDDNTEMEGIPLRICDIAYNQLILRYEIKNVLRTIGTVHRIEDRQYHIDILKKRL
jgi:hypothetical protein